MHCEIAGRRTVSGIDVQEPHSVTHSLNFRKKLHPVDLSIVAIESAARLGGGLAEQLYLYLTSGQPPAKFRGGEIENLRRRLAVLRLVIGLQRFLGV